ncbi:MAG TPA: hypothetical protein VHP83_05145, partial [Aggregatilineaceae bacterium]|nr:hypothetical protein [Aggregatilineaceae bacterium]
MPPIDDLLNEIFDGQNPAFYPEFEAWVRGSRRFKAFATSYRTKIRAKLKNAQRESGILDLRAELETAMLMLRDERLTLEYETYAALKTRGPDFTVTFKTHTLFNVEVRRLRGFEQDEDTEAQIGKLMAVLCDKVGQMPPSIINVLWLVSEGKISEADLSRTAAALRQRAESKDDTFFMRRGFQSAVDFL